MDEPMEGCFDDDGAPMNSNLTVKPSLCIMCKHDGDPKQEVLCILTRLGQQEEAEFHCDSFEEK